MYVHTLQHKLLYRILRLLTCVNNIACCMGTYCGIMLIGKINCYNFGWAGEASCSTPSERSTSDILCAANKAVLTRIILQRILLTFVAVNEVRK